MIKADSSENKLDEKTINNIAAELGITPEEAPKKPVKKPAARKPRAKKDPNKVPTLSEFAAEEQYIKSDEYKQHVEMEEQLVSDLENPDIIDNLLESTYNIDLNSIEIDTDDDSDFADIDEESLNFILNKRPTYQVVLNQSAYIAHVEGLRYSDVLAIAQSTSSQYEDRLKRYQMYFDKINTNSIGIKSFNEWIHNTSMFDINSLAFGIFNQTFPGDTEFTIICQHCNQELRDVKIGNDQLISVKNEDAYEQLDRVINSVSDISKARKYSITNKTTRIQLPKSGIIVDIKTPTLDDHLKLLREIREDKRDQVDSYTMQLLYIQAIYVPNLAKLKASKKLSYRKKDSRNDIFKFTTDMNLDDMNILIKAIAEKSDKYEIDFKIKSFPCTHCGEELGDIVIDPENLLFQEALHNLAR